MKLSQTSFISFLLSFPTILLFHAMNKIHILILSVITFTCFSCQKQNPKTQLRRQLSISVNLFIISIIRLLKNGVLRLHYPILVFQHLIFSKIIWISSKHKERQKLLSTSSEITPDSEMATVICQIKNAFIINPINGKAERFSSLQDTLQLIKEGNKWLVRKDIPLQNGKQNHD